jgi:acetyltransferase EpsM
LENWRVEGILDWNYQGNHESIMGHEVIGGQELIEKDLPENLFIAIGDNNLRQKVVSSLKEKKFCFPNIINPYSFVDPTSIMNEGNFIGHEAFIGPMTRIDSFNIVNTHSILEHESSLGSFVHMAPASIVCGRASLESNILLGVGAMILPNTYVNHGNVIGASASVISDIKVINQTHVGIPAKIK